MMNIKYTTLIIIGVIGYLVWAAMAILDPSLRHDFLAFNIMMASGTIGVVVRDMKSGDYPKPPPSPPVAAPTVIVKELP